MLAGVVVIGGGAAAYVNIERSKREKEEQCRRDQAVGRPDIGGPFKLTDVHGKPFGSEDLKGKWSLLYFGFTFCPDICPDELDKMTEALNTLAADKDMPEVQPVFITIDPDRDTPEKLQAYLQDFHPKLLGLTGTNAEVKAAAKVFRVYYSKPIEDESDDYLVDHTIIMYLMDPEFQFAQYFGQFMTAPEMAQGMAETMEKYIPPP